MLRWLREAANTVRRIVDVVITSINEQGEEQNRNSNRREVPRPHPQPQPPEVYRPVIRHQQVEEEDEEDYDFVDDYDDDFDGSNDLFDNKWRREAGERWRLMKDHFKQKNDFRNVGDHESAKKHAKLAQGHRKEMEEANKLAVKHIMETNKNNTSNTIDLHGLYVNEALEEVKKKLDTCRGRIRILTIITGRGSHSENQRARIKPKIVEYLDEEEYNFGELNPGSLAVYLT